MLEQYFLRPTTVDQIRSNWLAPQIEQYVEWMHAQKYARQNITRRIALLCHFADFARINGATDLASTTSTVEKFGDRYVRELNRLADSQLRRQFAERRNSSSKITTAPDGRQLQPFAGHDARIFRMGSRAEVHQTQPRQSEAQVRNGQAHTLRVRS